MKKKKIILIICLVIVVLVALAFDKRLKTIKYDIDTHKVASQVRLALVTDLHSCYYGENQEQLIEKIDKYAPDAVLLGGDIFDDYMDNTNSRIFVKNVAEKHKTYYVSGNHEWWSGQMYEFFDYMSECGVIILRGNCDILDVREEKINICGVDDPDVDVYDTTPVPWVEQLKTASANAPEENFTVLLTHRPEIAAEYFKYNFDLALAGHAHGGQFRIPFVLNGFFAPNQGFLPKLAGGEYDFDGKKMIVSRGLSDEDMKIPRIFNRPELVFVNINPK